MADVGSLRNRILQLEEEIRHLQKEREAGEDFIFAVNNAKTHNSNEFDRRNALAIAAGERRGKLTFADKLMLKLQANYGSSRVQQTTEPADNMINKANTRIEQIDTSIAEKRREISELEAEIERILEAERKHYGVTC